MTVEIVCVGTELLLGNIVNTNAAYLAEQCAGIGLSCYYQSVVGDNKERLLETIRTAIGRSDIVLLSGGLGPTQDDLTKETAALAMGKELMLDEHSRQRIEEYFAKKGVKITDNNWKQAYVPKDSIVLDNHNGTAPGMIMESDAARVILLPGPPNELKPMFEESVRPYLEALEPGVICSKIVKICGVPESTVETEIKDLIEAQGNPTIAPYAKTGEVHIRVTAKANDEKEAKSLIKPVVRELKARFGMDVYSTEEGVDLQKAVVELLLANKLTVSTVESCTGGMLAARLIDIPGVSESFKYGYITYSNKAKRRILGVKKATLEKYGAVSAQTAKEMAKGAALLSKSDVTVAITGIAGPDGGTEEKPVGLVYVACQICGRNIVKELRLSGNRNKIRETTVAQALILMRKSILEYYSQQTFGKEK